MFRLPGFEAHPPTSTPTPSMGIVFETFDTLITRPEILATSKQREAPATVVQSTPVSLVVPLNRRDFDNAVRGKISISILSMLLTEVVRSTFLGLSFTSEVGKGSRRFLRVTNTAVLFDGAFFVLTSKHRQTFITSRDWASPFPLRRRDLSGGDNNDRPLNSDHIFVKLRMTSPKVMELATKRD